MSTTDTTEETTMDTVETTRNGVTYIVAPDHTTYGGKDCWVAWIKDSGKTVYLPVGLIADVDAKLSTMRAAIDAERAVNEAKRRAHGNSHNEGGDGYNPHGEPV